MTDACNLPAPQPKIEQIEFYPDCACSLFEDVDMVASARRRRGFEPLEPRHMLAGDVTAELVNGDLLITADDNKNTIFLFNFIEFTLGADGPVNGSPNGAVFPGFSGNVVVRLLEGNDTLLLGGLFPGALVIESGDGDDLIGLTGGGLSVTRELIIDLGAGPDEISLTYTFQTEPNVRVGTSVIVNGGEGADRIHISELSAGRDFVINGDAGADALNVFHVTTGNFFGIDGGLDADSISASAVNARVASLRSGGGAGSLDLFLCAISGDLGMIGGDGASIVRLYTSVVGGTTYIVGGAGNDYVEVEANQLRELQVNSGDGYDRVQLNGSLLDRIFADLGVDGDLLVMNNTAISGTGSLSGGAHYDVFFGRGNLFGGATLASFELFT